jgi:hypothetical protein
MKTTKELIIEDITAKVEAKLASQNVKLAGNLSDIEKALPKVLKDYETFRTLHNSMMKIAAQGANIGNTLSREIDAIDKDVAFFMSAAEKLGIDPKTVPIIKAYFDKMQYIDNEYLEFTTDFMEDAKSVV